MNNSVDSIQSSVVSEGDVSRRDAETQREEIIKTTSLLEKAFYLITSNNFLSGAINIGAREEANLHIGQEVFLSTFSEFCYKPSGSVYFKIYTLVNNVVVYSFIHPSKLGIKTKTVTEVYEVEI